MLFFFLLGACVASKSLSGIPSIPAGRAASDSLKKQFYPRFPTGPIFDPSGPVVRLHGALSPISKPSTHQVSLIETAKTNPRALIKLLEGADKDTLVQIITLLNQLRDEGIAEHKKITGILTTAKAKLKAAQEYFAVLRKKEGEAKIRSFEATEAFNQAEGSLTETIREHDTEAPGLKKEIDIFQKVLNILNGLLNGQPQDKNLLELGMEAEARTYQKMIENIKADPAKLKKVIELIGKLLAQSKTDLAALEKAVRDATAVRNAAEKVKISAEGVHIAAEAAVQAQSAVVSEHEGELQEAQQQYDTRIPVLDGEKKTLEEVIQLLKNMLAEQEKQ